MKRGREAEDRPASGDDADSRKLKSFEKWLESHGCAFAGDVSIRRNGDGSGFGVYAQRRLVQEDFARLPEACVLTAERALASRAASDALAKGASSSFAIWCFLASCRFRHGRTGANEEYPMDDPIEKEFRAYVEMLPAEGPDPLAWREDARALLHGTPLGNAVEHSRRKVKAEYERVRPAGLTFEQILWGRSVRVSRFYPSVLARAAAATGPTSRCGGHSATQNALEPPLVRIELDGGNAPKCTFADGVAVPHPPRLASGVEDEQGEQEEDLVRSLNHEGMDEELFR